MCWSCNAFGCAFSILIYQFVFSYVAKGALMPICGVKRRRTSVDREVEEESIDLEQQQRSLLDMSVSKLQQEQSGQGSEPKLLKSVLISNAVRRLQFYMTSGSEFDIDILSTEEEGEAGTPLNFLSNTFGPSGYLSVVPSPCPEAVQYCEEEQEEECVNTSSNLPTFTAVLFERLQSIMEVEVENGAEMYKEVTTQVEVPYEPPSTSIPCTTAGTSTTSTADKTVSLLSSVAGECTEEVNGVPTRGDGVCHDAEISFDPPSHSKGISCTEPLSDDSGLGESMDVPLSLVVQDFHSVDLSLYDYDSQDPLHPTIGCLNDTQIESAHSESPVIAERSETPSVTGIGDGGQSLTAMTTGGSRYGPHRESPLVTVCRRSDHSNSSANFLGFGNFSGLFVES